jgi:hypothetical protein
LTVAYGAPITDRGRRADQRAEQLLASVVGSDAFAMYADLGFLEMSREGYGYLIYPHRPVVAYDARNDEPLNEYCVLFPDEGEPGSSPRLPDADDVLAKWLALRGDERRLLADANLDAPGRQLDPEHVRRDLRTLRIWRARREMR